MRNVTTEKCNNLFGGLLPLKQLSYVTIHCVWVAKLGHTNLQYSVV